MKLAFVALVIAAIAVSCNAARHEISDEIGVKDQETAGFDSIS